MADVPEEGAVAGGGGEDATVDAGTESAGESPTPEVRHSPRMMFRRRLVRVRRFVRRSFWSLVLLAVVVIAFAAQTARGQDIVLRTVLNEVRSSLAGELTIQGIRSGTLLTGATLRDVRLDAEGGTPFLVADSVLLRYSLLSTITGGSPIRSTTVWGADITVSRYAEEETVNVARLLADRDSASASGEGRPTRLGHVAIRQGRARIVSPSGGSKTSNAEGPGGEPVRELTFDGLDIDVENAVLVPGGSVIFQADLASFSSVIGIRDEPLRVREVFGTLTYGDQGIRISDAAFRMPGTLVEGDLRVGPAEPGAPWTFWTDLRTRGWGDLADLHWVDPRIPEGRFTGAAEIDVAGRVAVGMRQLRVELEASDVVFDGNAVFDDRMVLDDMAVTASPVTLERLEPWLERDIPLDGWLSGEGVFSGTLDDLTGAGRMTLVPTGYGGRATTMEFDGNLRLADGGGARDFRARLQPLNYDVLAAFWPEFPWAGQGDATVELDGGLDDGLEVVAFLNHQTDAAEPSAVEARGYLWRGADGEGWITDMVLDLRPLALATFASLAPELGLEGSISGPAQVEGPFNDLAVGGEFETVFGRVELDSRVNLGDPASNYRVALAADSLPLSRLAQSLPPETRWSGSLVVEGSGSTVDSVDVAFTVLARRSRLGPLRVDTLAASGRVQAGVLVTEELQGRIGGIEVRGRGRLGLLPGRGGASTAGLSAQTLAGPQKRVMGVPDPLLVSDGWSPLARELLRLQGVEPDTLPTARDVRLEGRIAGAASVSGSIDDLDLGLIVDVVGGAYKQNQVDTARVAFTATSLPATLGDWEIGASAIGIVFEGREFERGGFEADMLARAGAGRIEVVRRPGEEYRARGSFAFDSVGGRIELDEASVRVDEQHWVLAQAGPVSWGDATVSVDSVVVVREGEDPMQFVVDGDLTRQGQSDFRVQVDGLQVDRILYVAQREDVQVGGHVSADLTVRGTSRAPEITGEFTVLGPRYSTMQLTRIDGSVGYSDRSLDVEVQGWDAVRTVVTGSATLPLDLGLGDVPQRVLDEPMDVRIAADSLDAAIALSYLTSLDGVLGTVSGDVRVRGTPRFPEPEGTVELRNAAWSVDAIGVRHQGIDGELRFRPDRTVDVSLAASRPGRATVTGTLTLEPVRDPELNLEFEFDRFLAVSRADMEGYVSGGFTLTETYTRPLAEGALTVDEGTIYVDDLQRAASVVDLSDPFLFDVGLAVDTTALVSQPLFAGLRNPFFDNLRVNVDLAVPRGTWLRSIDTNVEMTGDLLVRYDRSAGDFVLIGDLEAIRGSHRVLGRNFQLEGGTIAFIGRPGLNPDLAIAASTRIRSPDEAPITIDAQVTGTLVQPVVTLSSEEAGLAEEDLISYIVFGQPSAALGGSSGAAGQLQELNAVSSVSQGTLTLLGGAFANQLGSALARELPVTLDYVSIQQLTGAQTIGRSFAANTFSQVELGRYIGDDVFAIFVLRPFATEGQDENKLAGVRVEIALNDNYNVELFREDRFLRSGSTGLRTSSSLLGQDEILGVFLFREWGYSPTRDR